MKPRFIDMDQTRQAARKEDAMQDDVQALAVLLDLQARGETTLPEYYTELRAKADERLKAEGVTEVEVRAARRKFLSEMWIPNIETQYAQAEAKRDLAVEKDEDPGAYEEQMQRHDKAHEVACEALDGLLTGAPRAERRAAAKRNGKGRVTPRKATAPSP